MIFGVLPIYPGHAAVHLLGIGVNASAIHPRDYAPIAILHAGPNLSFLAETKIGKGLLRFCAKRLPLFWRIDLGQPYLDLLLVLFQDGDGIAIGDTDYRGKEERREHSGFALG